MVTSTLSQSVARNLAQRRRSRSSLPETKRQPPTLRFLPWVRSLLLLLQLLLLLAPLQSAGAFHAIADIFCTLAGEQVHQGRALCSYEEHGERCPPGCPDCHCARTIPAVLPVLLSIQFENTIVEPIILSSRRGSPPPKALTPGIERPPRFRYFS